MRNVLFMFGAVLVSVWACKDESTPSGNGNAAGDPAAGASVSALAGAPSSEGGAAGAAATEPAGEGGSDCCGVVENGGTGGADEASAGAGGSAEREGCEVLPIDATNTSRMLADETHLYWVDSAPVGPDFGKQTVYRLALGESEEPELFYEAFPGGGHINFFADADNVYVTQLSATQTNLTLVKLPKEGSAAVPLRSGIRAVDDSLTTEGVNVYYVNADANLTGDGIWSQPVGGGAATMITPTTNGLGYGTGITAAGGNLYWASSVGGTGYRVWSVATSGGTPVAITAASQGLELEPFVEAKPYIYWRDSATISRTLLTGGAVETVASGTSESPRYSVSRTQARLVESDGYVYFPARVRLPGDTGLSQTLLVQRVAVKAASPAIPEVIATVPLGMVSALKYQQIAINHGTVFVLDAGTPVKIFACPIP